MTAPMTAPLLDVQDLRKEFLVRAGRFGFGHAALAAVDGVSFTVSRGETLSLVGESGCGKSTVGRAILRLITPTAGEIRLDGQRIDDLPEHRLRPLRRRIQVVFQDPFSSLNPRLTVGEILAEPLRNFGLVHGRAARAERLGQLADAVGLAREALGRRPHEFSGGQRQRIGIARALALNPKLIVCDEPVSALDVSIQAQVLNLLSDLQSEMGLSYLFIAHNLAVVEHFSDRIAVMYLGRIVETAPARLLTGDPKHPYTQALLSAVPKPEVDRKEHRMVLQGEVPSPANPPSGCPFHPRCPIAKERCSREMPPMEIKGGNPDHLAACWETH